MAYELRIQWCKTHNLGGTSLGMGPRDCPYWWSDWIDGSSPECEWEWMLLITPHEHGETE